MLMDLVSMSLVSIDFDNLFFTEASVVLLQSDWPEMGARA